MTVSTEQQSPEIWQNKTYYVAVWRNADSGVRALTIRRLDWEACSDWRDKQAIKTQIAGAECEAMELYPAESRVVDRANWSWLYVLPPGERFPYGFSNSWREDAPPHESASHYGQRPLAQRGDTEPLVQVKTNENQNMNTGIECSLTGPEAPECFQLRIGEQFHNLHAWQLLTLIEAVNLAWLHWLGLMRVDIIRSHLELDQREKLLQVTSENASTAQRNQKETT